MSQLWFGVEFNITATIRPSRPTVRRELGQLLGPLPPSQAPPPTLAPEKRSVGLLGGGGPESHWVLGAEYLALHRAAEASPFCLGACRVSTHRASAACWKVRGPGHSQRELPEGQPLLPISGH